MTEVSRGRSSSTQCLGRGVSVEAYGKYLEDLHATWGDKRPEVEAAVAKTLGIENRVVSSSGGPSGYRSVPTLSARNGSVVVEDPYPLTYDENDDYGWDFDRNDEGVPDVRYISDADFMKSPYLREVQFVDDGYYGEDSYVQYTYDLPEEYKEAVEKLDEVDATAGDVKYLRKGLPKWAALPETMNDADRVFQRWAPVSEILSRLGASKETGKFTKGYPAKPSVKKLDDVINHKEAASRARETEAAHAKKVAEWESYEKMMADEKGYPTGTEVTSPDGRSFKLNKKLRKWAAPDAARRKAGVARAEESARENAERLEAVKASDVVAARERKARVLERHEKAAREWAVGRLSNRFPSRDEAVRRKAAEKWLAAHPEAAEVLRVNKL